MSTLRFTILAALLFLVGAVTGVPAQMGHQPGQGMGMSQDHMLQMQEMMQRMSGVMHQAHQMSQSMQQHMQQQNGQMMQQHQMMQRMDECVGNMAEHMQATMEQQHRMMQDTGLMQDPQMQRDMEQLQEHMGAMTGRLEQSVEILQRLNKKLTAPSPKE